MNLVQSSGMDILHNKIKYQIFASHKFHDSHSHSYSTQYASFIKQSHDLVIINNHIINNFSNLDPSMTTPCTRRHRNQHQTPKPSTPLFKVFDTLSAPPNPNLTTLSQNRQMNSSQSVSRMTSTPLISDLKGEGKISISSQLDLLPHEHSSFSMNQSSPIPSKNKHLQLNFIKPDHNGSSMALQPSNTFLNPEHQKLHRKNSDMQYYHQKKSYRNPCQGTTLGVPYRKCHSSMEQKIVNIINKIKVRKECYKEIETLLYRAGKVSTKELSNKYFVSGLYVIKRLIQQELDDCELKNLMMSRISTVISEIKSRIYEELDCIRCFQNSGEKVERRPEVDKSVLIRKAYRVLKKKQGESRKELQRRAIQLAENYLSEQADSLHNFWVQLDKVQLGL